MGSSLVCMLFVVRHQNHDANVFFFMCTHINSNVSDSCPTCILQTTMSQCKCCVSGTVLQYVIVIRHTLHVFYGRSHNTVPIRLRTCKGVSHTPGKLPLCDSSCKQTGLRSGTDLQNVYNRKWPWRIWCNFSKFSEYGKPTGNKGYYCN